MFAARNGDIEMAKLLIAAGVGRQRDRDPTARTCCRMRSSAGRTRSRCSCSSRAPIRTARSTASPRCTPRPARSTLARATGRDGTASAGRSALGGGVSNLSCDRALRRRQGAAREGRRPERPHHDVGDVHGLHRLSEEGRVRAVRDRAPAICAARRRSGWRPTPPTAASAASAATAPGMRGRSVRRASDVMQGAARGRRESAPDDRRRHDAADGGGGAGPRDLLSRACSAAAARQSAEEAVDGPARRRRRHQRRQRSRLHRAARRGVPRPERSDSDPRRPRRRHQRARLPGRTPYRIAEGSKQSFQFQAYPETAEFIKTLGANTRLGVPGTVQERARDLTTLAAEVRAAGQQ